MGYRQGVRHSTLTAAFIGSNPFSPATKARRVRQRIESQRKTQVEAHGRGSCSL